MKNYVHVLGGASNCGGAIITVNTVPPTVVFSVDCVYKIRTSLSVPPNYAVTLKLLRDGVHMPTAQGRFFA